MDTQKTVDTAAKTECAFATISSIQRLPEAGDEDYSAEDYSPVCGTPDSLKSAQTAYLISIIIVQFANLWFCKTRKLALWQQGLGNMFQNLSIVSEFGLGMSVGLGVATVKLTLFVLKVLCAADDMQQV